MNRLLKIGFLLSVILIFASCNSSKKAVSYKNTQPKVIVKDEISTSKEKDQLRQITAMGDEVFDKLEAKLGSSLNAHTLNYIDNYKNIAVKKMMEYKIPASITLAQGVLESGNGRSELTRKANNHFGIKCHKGWEGKKVHHDDDEKHECFRKYNYPEESFDDHSMFLTTRSRYAGLFELDADDYKAWAKGLKNAGYATDRKYPDKLIKIIEEYKLYEYDDLVLGVDNDKKRKRKSEEEVVSNNYIIVNKGDTLYSIAKNNSTTVERIKALNSLTTNNLNIGQKIYLD
ncbi:glucosaminidase domain-containing protein [Namhaeicola litoreus]|uniref:Peptidoglycan hydrolase n=1 Tax=Namhaeicola litoreus TaxID=1052145 RepID=A0ABW3Y2X0_9FLAO